MIFNRNVGFGLPAWIWNPYYYFGSVDCRHVADDLGIPVFTL